MSFPMEVKIMESDCRIRENIGKVAVERGPIVYCLEEKDNGADLHLISLDSQSEAVVEDAEICGEKIKMVVMGGFKDALISEKGLYNLYSPKAARNVTLKYIPYYTWANRGENEMQVWSRVK